MFNMTHHKPSISEYILALLTFKAPWKLFFQYIYVNNQQVLKVCLKSIPLSSFRVLSRIFQPKGSRQKHEEGKCMEFGHT